MMPNHPPKTLSHEDAKFIEETLRHCKERVKPTGTWTTTSLEFDIDRCIKILESEDG